VRQCELVGLPRSSYYYGDGGGESDENLQLMRLIDEQYLRTPFYGSPRMTEWLRGKGFVVNHKRIARLMQLMDLEAVYPKPRLSKPGAGHRIYPYLLRNLPITAVNQVWSTDISVPQQAAWKMEVGPSESAYRSRFQTTISGGDQESLS
jgi:putative transposase